MPAPKPAVHWGGSEVAAMLKGFREQNWDPYLTSGKEIFAVVHDAVTDDDTKEEYAILLPFFSKKHGGSQKDNNKIYTHYKTTASEYITTLARLGIRRKEHIEWRERNNGSRMFLVLLQFPFFFILTHLFSLSITEKFIQENGAAGGRKRQVEEGNEEEDEDEDEEEEADGEETEEDEEEEEEEEMPKIKTPNRKAAKKASSSKKKKAVVEIDELDDLADGINDLALDNHAAGLVSSSDALMGFDYRWKAPFHFHTYHYNASAYTTFDLLSWTTAKEDITFNVIHEGTVLRVTNNLLSSMLNKRRHQARYGIDNDSLADHLYYQSAIKHSSWVTKMVGGSLNKIVPHFDIPLPYACQEQLVDPYEADQIGKKLGFYRHDRYNAADGNSLQHRVCMVHVTVKSKEERLEDNAAGSADIDY